MADADDDAGAGADESARRKSHAARMFRWEDQLARDHGLSNFAVRFGVVIRSYVDAATGSARASDVSYAKRLGIWKEPPSDRKTKFYEDGTRIIRRTKIELAERRHLKKGPGKCLTPILHEQREANANPDSGARVSPSQTRAQESGFQTEDIKVAPGKPGHGSPPTRTPESENPDSGVPVPHLSESSSDSSTTSSSSPKTEYLEDDQILEEIVLLHGYQPSPKTLHRWRGNIWTARVRGTERVLLLAVRAALMRGGEKGQTRLTSTTDLLDRWEQPMRDYALMLGSAPSDFEEFFEAWGRHAATVVARRAVVKPKLKATAKKFTQREQDDRRRKKQSVMRALGFEVGLTVTAPWLTNEIAQLEESGLSFDEVIAACRHARTHGPVPRSLDDLRQHCGGLATLVRHVLGALGHAHPPSSTVN